MAGAATHMCCAWPVCCVGFDFVLVMVGVDGFLDVCIFFSRSVCVGNRFFFYFLTFLDFLSRLIFFSSVLVFYIFSYIGNHTYDFPALLGLVAKKKKKNSANGHARKECIISYHLFLLASLTSFCDAQFFDQPVHYINYFKGKQQKMRKSIEGWTFKNQRGLFNFFTYVDSYFLACRVTTVIMLHQAGH